MQARRYLLVVLALSLVASFSMALGVSAQDDAAAQAVRDAGTNCANLALNTTCLGAGTVVRTTSSGVISTTYTQPGDRASINTTHRVQTGADGVNFMKLQAGLPVSSGGVVYIAFGSLTVTNVGGAGQAVWQNITVTPDDETGPFLVQGPEDYPATVTINGTTIELHSTAAVWFGPDGSLVVYVLSGSAIVNGVTVPAGYKVSIGPDGALGSPSMLTPEDIAALEILGSIPGNLLNYEFALPVISCPSGVGSASCTVIAG